MSYFKYMNIMEYNFLFFKYKFNTSPCILYSNLYQKGFFKNKSMLRTFMLRYCVRARLGLILFEIDKCGEYDLERCKREHENGT